MVRVCDSRIPSSSSSAASSHPPPPTPAAAASFLLAPGFRFHPTDDEIVSYYLKRKVLGRPLRVDAIAEVELYKAEPWDLPALSRLRSRDIEWYFFSPLDRKFANRSRSNRTTSQGYWKSTGKDRPIRRGPRTVGMKKTLVFHVGRAPRGERTNWVMHEYRLEDDELTHAGIPQDSYVVCRIFQKSGTGPQNGAQYGAPFNEEEWEEEEASDTPFAIFDNSGDVVGHNQGMAAGGNESAVVGDEGYFRMSDFAENSYQNEEQSNQLETGSVMTVDSVGQNLGNAQEDDPIFSVESVFRDQEYTGLVNALGPQDLQSGMDNYILMNDLYSPIMGSGCFTAVEDVVSYYDSPYNSHYPTDDSPEIMSAGSTLIKPNFPLQVGRTVATPTQAFKAVGASSVNLPGARSRSNVIIENVAVLPDSRRVEGCNSTFTKLGSISAPAFAAEPSFSIHVTAGMIQIRGFEVMGRAEHWSMHRNGDMEFVLSCGVASRKCDSVPKVRGWSLSVVMCGGLYCFLFSALVLALCCKVGIRICSS